MTTRDRETLPADVREIEAPQPAEISGVAALPEGYAVVGDEDPHHGYIWPGGQRFDLPKGLRGPESIAVGRGPDGNLLWLVLDEKRRTVVDRQGGHYKLPKEFDERAGRGAEGLGVRWTEAGWQLAVAWEGGFYDPGHKRLGGQWARPKVALCPWETGIGYAGEPQSLFELDVPQPSPGQRFRASDLTWMEDDLLVLLTATDAAREHTRHTWLQRFDLQGQPRGTPLKLEERWPKYWEDKNWEALDRTWDGAGLVLGHDEKDPRRHCALAVFPYTPV